MKVSLPIISISVMALLLWSGCSSKEEPPPPKQAKIVKAIKKPPQAPPTAKEETAKPEPAKVEAAKAEPPKTELLEKTPETPKAPPPEPKVQKEEKKEPEPKRAPTQEKAPVTQASTKTEKKAVVPEEVFYTVVKGDTLSGVAGKAEIYKDPLKWPVLYRINTDALGNMKLGENFPDMELPVGSKLRIVTPGEVKQNLGNRAAKMWVINVLSATTNAEVVPAVINLAKNRYPVYITVAKVKEKDWMRVRVGFFKERAEAEAEGKKILTMLNFSDSWTTKLGQNEFAEFADISGTMKGKKIIVGVTGGIAAYKAAELVRLMVKEGAETRVAMTAHATEFVTPLTFEALSGHRVVWDMWSHETSPMDHISWGQGADLIIVAPATANFIGKMAHGIGDDFLSTLVIAATAKVLICPSMNSRMFMNPIVQSNIRLLKERGFVVMEPGEGELACGTEGPGRLPEPEDIAEEALILLSEQDLTGLRILVTAGATVEPMDPVRYLTNRSSGKMGYALARAARMRGAEVVLVSGPTNLQPPRRVTVMRVSTTEEMRKVVMGRRHECDVILKAAAVLDYRPREKAAQKIKKDARTRSLELVPNPDILAELGRTRGKRRSVLVGFAAETTDLLANAKEKLKKKNLDMIVANDVSRKDAGFESDTNLVKLIYRDGTVEDLPLMTKLEVADQILDRVKRLWEKTS